jgi:BlaR1 peptidase M56
VFVIRGVLVSFGFFGALYCLLSLLVVFVWRCWYSFGGKSESLSPSLLFALRILPIAGSAFVTLVFALPAFLLLETSSIDEDIGTVVFGICALLIFAVGLARVWAARTKASAVITEWMDGASPLDAGTVVPTLHTRNGLPPLVLVGLAKPKVLISEEALSLLSESELRVAVQHEISHIKSRDNLKKLIFHSATFPGMGTLERAWHAASELASDNAAVSSRREAVDLAAALIKLSELPPVQAQPAFTSGLADVPSLVKQRVEHLLAWNENNLRCVSARLYFFVPATLAVAVCLIANYGKLLFLTHQLTEWIIH